MRLQIDAFFIFAWHFTICSHNNFSHDYCRLHIVEKYIIIIYKKIILCCLNLLFFHCPTSVCNTDIVQVIFL